MQRAKRGRGLAWTGLTGVALALSVAARPLPAFAVPTQDPSESGEAQDPPPDPPPPDDPPDDPADTTQDPPAQGAGEGGEPQEGEPPVEVPQEPPGEDETAAPIEEPTAESAEELGQDPPPSVRGPAGGPSQPSEAPTPSLPDFAPAYRSLEDGVALLEALARAVPAARVLELAGEGAGRPLTAIEFGRPDGAPLVERPTVLLVGGLDGRSRSGCEAVLAVVRRLLEEPARLPEDVAFVAVPWASPAALAREGGVRDGRGARPLDEDGDGRADEDGPDDVDGDGLILSMLIEHAEGEWAVCSDGRFLVPAGPGDAPLYRRVPEGRDDDGDGRFNEDPPGGVVLDRNFPLGREGAWRDPLSGAVPFSEPEVRALADLALARRTAVVLLFQGNHGGVATPGGSAGPGGVDLPLAEDGYLFERATEAFAAFTARTQEGARTLREARGGEVHGAALDWFYAGVGAFALEVAPWGPRVEGNGAVVAQDARFQTSPPAVRALGARPEMGETDRRWAAWLDNTRGGIGFVDWHPVDLGGGQQAMVGGWEARTIHNPPEASLAAALEGLAEFTAGLSSGLPRLEIRDVLATREEGGEVVRVRARLKNLGALPTGLAGAGGPGHAGALSLSLVVPSGARLIAGEPRVELGRLGGGELSRDVDWILIAPVGATLVLQAESELALPVAIEVRP